MWLGPPSLTRCAVLLALEYEVFISKSTTNYWLTLLTFRSSIELDHFYPAVLLKITALFSKFSPYMASTDKILWNHHELHTAPLMRFLSPITHYESSPLNPGFHTRYVPPSGFLNLLTVYSSTRFQAFFHALYISGVYPKSFPLKSSIDDSSPSITSIISILYATPCMPAATSRRHTDHQTSLTICATQQTPW
jgi:hypothetical protein